MCLQPFPLHASPPQQLVVISALSDSTGSQPVMCVQDQGLSLEKGVEIRSSPWLCDGQMPAYN